MTRGAFLKKYFPRFAAALALFGLAVYLLAHALESSAGSLLTTPVRYVSDTEITTSRAYLFREEEVLTAPADTLIDELVPAGEKVGKNVELLRLYPLPASAESAEELQLRLDRLNRDIRILEESTLPAGTTLAKAEEYRTSLLERYADIRKNNSSGEIGAVASAAEEFLVLQNRYTALLGSSGDSAAVLDALRKEKEALLTTAPQTRSSSTASAKFYGRADVDGYESVFTPEEVNRLTPERFHELTRTEPRPAPDGSVFAGKLVYGYVWYLATEVDRSAAEHLTAGDSCLLGFPENGGKTVSMKLSSRTESGNRVLLVFEAETEPSGFLFYRSQTVEITVGTTRGFYIPSTALQNVNGAEGVYIFEASTARFRRVEILYRGDGYCIAKTPEDSEVTEIAFNDLLITSGKNLYDGKGYQ